MQAPKHFHQFHLVNNYLYLNIVEKSEHPFGDLSGLRPPGADYLSRLMSQQGESAVRFSAGEHSVEMLSERSQALKLVIMDFFLHF